MFFFLQEKNNTDHVSFYTPQIISDMMTQAVCDELDESDVLFGRETAYGKTGPSVNTHILLTTSLERSTKSFSDVFYSPGNLRSPAAIAADFCGDFGKSIVYEHESRKAKPLQSSKTNSTPTKLNTTKLNTTKLNTTKLIVIKPFNIYSPYLTDYLRHLNMLSNSIVQFICEIDKK